MFKALPDENSSSPAGVPPAILEGLRGYGYHGIPTGGFLRATLENDLAQSVGMADDQSLAAIGRIVSFVYNCLPSKCWGSKEKVQAWIKMKEQEREATECSSSV